MNEVKGLKHHTCRLYCITVGIPLQGYDTYISVFYILAAMIFSSIGLTLWVAWLLKKDENGNPWIKR
jgi:hypothetical protein